MSTTALPIVHRQPDFVADLLKQQQELSGVEQFSQWHSDQANGDTVRPAQEKYYRSLLPATAPGPDQQLAFEVDLDACSGCKACVVACHTLNGLEEDESWRRVGTLIIGQEDETDSAAIQHVTTACHHCEDPGCLNGCPVKAYDKDPITGIVRHLDDQCIGCKYCTMMCPYEVPKYSQRLGIVRKCDMCHQRLSVGEAPACVQSCPNEAIRIRTVAKDHVPESGETLVASAPRSQMTVPTTRYTTQRSRWNTASPQDANVDEVAESHWPLALMLVATQMAVGVLVAEAVVSGILWVVKGDAPAAFPLASGIVAFVLANIGLGIAPLHLGQPLRMWRVFLGLRTSWLSREAVVLGKFMGLLAGGIAFLALPLVWDRIPVAVQHWLPIEWIPQWTGRALLVLSIPVGLAGLYSSAMIYIATRRQLWRAERTLPRFFGTALTGGLMITAAIVGYFGLCWTACLMNLAAIGALAWKWSFERSVYLSVRERKDVYDRRSVRLILEQLPSLALGRECLLITSLVFAVAATVISPVAPLVAAVITTIAAGWFAAGELDERLLYFKSVVYDRMPGTL